MPDTKIKILNKITIWRTVIVMVVFIVGFYIFWLLPVLNDMSDRFYSHQLEIAEKIKIESKEVVVNNIMSKLSELALFTLPKLKNNETFDSIDPNDMSVFFENRDDIKEFFVTDLLGFEKLRISREKVFGANELKDLSKEDYFITALRSGISIKSIHINNEVVPEMMAVKRFNIPELGGFMFGIRVSIADQLRNFSLSVREKEGELVYIVDDRGIIINHYNNSFVGDSLTQEELIKGVFREKNNNGEIYKVGPYVNKLGEKFQSIALLFKPINFVIVVEEDYQRAWSARNQFILFSIIGIVSIIALIIILTRNTIKMLDVSNQLLKEKVQTESIIANLEVGIIEYDDNFVITLINPRAEEMLKIKKEDVLHQAINSEFIRQHSGIQPLTWILYPSLAANTKRVSAKDGSSLVTELRLEDLNGLYLQITTIKVFDQLTQTHRFLKVLRDISRDDAIAKSKSEFISVAAHQLRTPLSAIKWVFKMLLDGDVGAISEEQKDYLQKGYDSNERIIALVGDMLDVARIEEGRFGFEFYYVDIIDVVQKAIDNFEVKAKEKNIKLIFEKPNYIINPVKIDPARIGLVMQNLVDNALKYTRNDGIVNVKAEVLDSYVQISVSDTGIGIPKDQQAKLFGKFFRGANAVKLQTEGSGLGLFIVKNIVRQHGGDVWVKSEEGKGTTFYVALPLKEEVIAEQNGEKLSEFVEGLNTNS